MDQTMNCPVAVRCACAPGARGGGSPQPPSFSPIGDGVGAKAHHPGLPNQKSMTSASPLDVRVVPVQVRLFGLEAVQVPAPDARQAHGLEDLVQLLLDLDGAHEEGGPRARHVLEAPGQVVGVHLRLAARPHPDLGPEELGHQRAEPLAEFPLAHGVRLAEAGERRVEGQRPAVGERGSGRRPSWTIPSR